MNQSNNNYKFAQTIAGILTFSGAFQTKATQGNTLDFEQIIVLGDSLSDTGNAFNFTLGLIPNLPQYAPGRFSNGPVWVDYLAESQGLVPLPFSSLNPTAEIPEDGINFAVGGAKTDYNNVSNLGLPGLAQQVEAYQSLFQNQSPNPNALHIVWAGANDYLSDYRETTVATPPPSIDQVIETVRNLENTLATLAETGATTILVPNLPNLGATPLAQSRGLDAVTTLSNLSQEHNSELSVILEGLTQSYPDTNFINLEINQALEGLITNLEDYGITNTTDACTNTDLSQANPFPPQFIQCEEPDEFIYWDNQHPTTVAHQAIARAAEKELSVPEPGMIPALTLLGGIYLLSKRKRFAFS